MRLPSTSLVARVAEVGTLGAASRRMNTKGHSDWKACCGILWRSLVLFGCYVACVVLFFGITGFRLSAHLTGNLSPVVGWLWFPGIFLAFWTVGVHSDRFMFVSILANIAVYLVVPFLLWKLFVQLRKQRNRGNDEADG